MDAAKKSEQPAAGHRPWSQRIDARKADRPQARSPFAVSNRCRFRRAYRRADDHCGLPCFSRSPEQRPSGEREHSRPSRPVHVRYPRPQARHDGKEASAAISSRVPQVSKAAPDPGTAQFKPKARYIQAFSANGPQFKVLVTFIESYPYDPQRLEQLTSVFYTAIRPADTVRQRRLRSWCNVGTLNSPGVYLCAPNSPNLLLKGSELILEDNSVAQRERAARNAQTTGATADLASPPFMPLSFYKYASQACSPNDAKYR